MAHSKRTITDFFQPRNARRKMPEPPASPAVEFVPCVRDPEFLYLLGLEQVAWFHSDAPKHTHTAPKKRKRRPARSPEHKDTQASVPPCAEPSVCGRCRADFSCSWKRSEEGLVTCDRCEAFDKKRALLIKPTRPVEEEMLCSLTGSATCSVTSNVTSSLPGPDSAAHLSHSPAHSPLCLTKLEFSSPSNCSCSSLDCRSSSNTSSPHPLSSTFSSSYSSLCHLSPPPPRCSTSSSLDTFSSSSPSRPPTVSGSAGSCWD